MRLFSILHNGLFKHPKSIMTPLFKSAFLGVLLIGSSPLFAQSVVQEADRLLEAGRFEDAASWCLEKLQDPNTEDALLFELFSRLAAAQQNLGAHTDAPFLLEEALELAYEDAASTERYANLLAQSADAWAAAGDSLVALQAAYRAVKMAEESGNFAVLSNASLTLANVLALVGYFDRAQAVYAQSQQQAEQAGQPLLVMKAALNRLRVILTLAEDQHLAQAMQQTQQALANVPSGREKTDALLSLGDLLASVLAEEKQGKLLPLATQHRAQAYTLAMQVLQEAALEAEQRQETRSLSLAYGHLAALYEQRQQWQQAIRLNRKALFYIRQEDHPEIQYLWEWQQGRLFRDTGDLEQAVAAFVNANETLDQEVRGQLELGYRWSLQEFDSHIRPVYYGLADLRLQQATQEPEPQAHQALLKLAFNAVEEMKVAELQNYFDNECIANFSKKPVEPHKTFPSTALIYPLPMENRLEVLLGVAGEWHQIKPQAVTAQQFKETTRAFRHALQNRSNSSFLKPSQQLYDWLIRPLLPALRTHKVDTLVFVPDGVLRQVPPSALHDGKHFLIEEFAISVTPALRALDATPLDWQNSDVLLAGLSHAVQGYSPLPGVANELKMIQELTGAVKLFNQAYTRSALAEKLRAHEYSVLHLATHGEFDSNPDYTYVLTYDEKMSMDKLQEVIGLGKYRKKPVELLILSACKTAVGDDRAALGLAGVAIKAGARSAIASLWFVDDESTMLTMQGFYKTVFKTFGMTKARALQTVQKSLIQQKRYWHPSYWSPFLLIGNWL